jgi:D-alanyl-D-alanine carboxypeptidase
VLANARQAAYVQAVNDVIATYHPPGVLAAVRVPGQAPWSQAFGLSDVASATPMALNSTFPIRSVTKSFTVTLILQMSQSGQLSLDDRIGRYITGVPNGNLISLADLAGMQSGLADYSAQPDFQNAFVENPLRVWTPQQLVAFAFAVTPTFLPGAQYQYSNTNTVLLGMVVEAVTGLPLADVLAVQILKPLALTGTTYPSSAALPPPTPTGYGVDVSTGVADAQPLISPTSLAASGAMASTLADLLAWGDALGSGSLLTAPLQAQRKAQSRAVTNGPEYDNYGLGIGQIGNWWGHTGSGVGFQVATLNLASLGATVSVMVNASPDNAPRHDLNIAQELFERLAAAVEAN